MPINLSTLGLNGSGDLRTNPPTTDGDKTREQMLVWTPDLLD